MKIKLLEGYNLTATDKKNIKLILKEGFVNKGFCYIGKTKANSTGFSVEQTEKKNIFKVVLKRSSLSSFFNPEKKVYCNSNSQYLIEIME